MQTIGKANPKQDLTRMHAMHLASSSWPEVQYLQGICRGLKGV